ncbi:MAG: ABC transporter permease [Sulfurospirillaceae bacterium]|nr:ABC transporter permease [Sulfurospirillaceae bacterium]
MQTIPIINLLYMAIPLSVVGYFYFRWTENKTEIFLATLRMCVQLIAIGYVLTSLFETRSMLLLSFLMLVMIVSSSLIARRHLKNKDIRTYMTVLFSIAFGGSVNLLLVLFFVLSLDNPFEPRFVIPLAGMLYANSMNAISLVAERFDKEILHNSYEKARRIAFKSSMIPQINSFLAVGFVSLPGMMTGQILSGVDPMIAVRYQIVVMAMVLGSSGISNIMYLFFVKTQHD